MEELAGGARMLPTKDSAASYDVEAIVGEEGKSRASKHYLVKYRGFGDAWWQPSKDYFVLSRGGARAGPWVGLAAIKGQSCSNGSCDGS